MQILFLNDYFFLPLSHFCVLSQPIENCLCYIVLGTGHSFLGGTFCHGLYIFISWLWANLWRMYDIFSHERRRLCIIHIVCCFWSLIVFVFFISISSFCPCLAISELAKFLLSSNILHVSIRVLFKVVIELLVNVDACQLVLNSLLDRGILLEELIATALIL